MNKCAVAALLMFVLIVSGCSSSSNPSDPGADPVPSGTIAFTSGRDGDFEVFTMDPDGGSLTQVTTDTAHDQATNITNHAADERVPSWGL